MVVVVAPLAPTLCSTIAFKNGVLHTKTLIIFRQLAGFWRYFVGFVDCPDDDGMALTCQRNALSGAEHSIAQNFAHVITVVSAFLISCRSLS